MSADAWRKLEFRNFLVHAFELRTVEFMVRVHIYVNVSVCEDTHTCLCVCLGVAACAIPVMFLQILYLGADFCAGACVGLVFPQV